MKKIIKEAEKTGKRKFLAFTVLGLGMGFLVLVIIIGAGQNDFGITTYLGGNNTPIIESPNTFTKIITGETNPTSNALFDIKLSVPEKYRLISLGEDVSIVIELINFGETEKTNVSISYIITNSEGDVVLIEHEKKVVETQMSYLKTIDLPSLQSGNYKLFVEILYSNTSAIANGEFNIA